MPVVFEPLLKHLPLLMMVFFRLTGLFIITPMISSRTIPLKLRVLLTFVMAVGIYPALAPISGGEGADPHVRLAALELLHDGSNLKLMTLPYLIGMELMIGFVIGFGALLLMTAIQVGGGIIDQQMGLGFAGIYNPEMNAQAGVVSQMFFLISTTVFVIMGGHRVLFQILLDSFSTIPIGGYQVNGQVMSVIVGLLQTAFELAVRIGGPILVLVFLETVAMGMIARTVPQMNILSIGFPLRILMGLILMVGTLSLVSELFQEQLFLTIDAIKQLVTPTGTSRIPGSSVPPGSLGDPGTP